MYSFWPTPPDVVNEDVPPLSNGRRYSGWPVHCMPEAMPVSANGLRSENGRLASMLVSITRPEDAVVVSSSGTSPVTVTISATAATSISMLIMILEATFRVTPCVTFVLKPASSAVIV